ncbi:hypothetical protein [Aquisalinus flavus]|uniref:Uncharacterized protein n=1 Tax=Aquisalinus flavus TaxID=1526572 RepID=A0A8J2Y7J7_9PROT|nr:hypothetical protein [Aquisalinus flavus]MBD0425503.1 hypothetical protein [Aquisalinus flavus]UNE48866.1 hypothetical protein FF099_12800 [Aquisalinus flavus]GGD15577.1 hypothetical protein GCM10011342_25410 [Aquisalinus flavus]
MRPFIAIALAATLLAACATPSFNPDPTLDSSLVGTTIEIMTGEEKRIVKVKKIEDGVIYTEAGETFTDAHIIDTNPERP